MADCGDITVVPADVTSNFNKSSQAVESVSSRVALPVLVVGDRAITFPADRGLSRFAALAIVHFDAHMDYTHDVQGLFHVHRNPIRRCHKPARDILNRSKRSPAAERRRKAWR